MLNMLRIQIDIIFILLALHRLIPCEAGYEDILDVGFSAQFQHTVEGRQDSHLVFSGTAQLEVSRPDSDTIVILGQQEKGHDGKSLVAGKVGLVVRTLGGRISSVVSSKSTSEADLNYLKSVASILFVHEGSWQRSYEMSTDIYGTCELSISRNETTSTVERDLTRCSHSSIEFIYSTHFLPLIHLAMDLSGSKSTCTYSWKNELSGILGNVSCTDEILVSARFSDFSLQLNLESKLLWKKTSPIDMKVYDYMREAADSTDLIYSPVMTDGDSKPEKDLNEILRELCLSSREHLTKKSLLTISEMFHALSMAKTAPDVLKYPCPTHIRRSVALSAALVGGSRMLSFVHDQMMTLVEEGEDLLPGFDNPAITLAISNLGEPKLNPKLQVDEGFFHRRENLEKLDKLIELLLVAGPEALTGVTNLLEKLRHLAPDLFKEILLKAAPVFSPEEACSEGGAKEATRILHAVSPLSVRPPDFVASLRPCFATEDVGVQVSAMMSLGSLDCATPGVLELEQLALESPSDPEIRIAAFKGLIDCLPRRPILIQTLKLVLDPENDNYSKQVASFVWSYVQSILESTDPNVLDLRLELEDDFDLVSIPDPVFYDPRQHSRHLENTWTLDPRTSVTVSLDLIWGRASAAPRSAGVSIVLSHDGTPYDVFELTVRISSIELAAIDLSGIKENFNSLRENVEDLWRTRREVDQNSVKSFIEKVISRIPADYQATDSSIQLSLSLLGLPAYHLYKADFQNFLKNISLTFQEMIQPDLHSEIFHLMPLLDNGIEIGTSAGVPIKIRLWGSSGFQSLISHYGGESSGNIDIGISGGVLFSTSLVMGSGTPDREESGGLSIKKGVTQGVDVLSSSVSSKYSWTFDFPLSFSYENKVLESRLKFRRPVSLPHFLWQEEKVTSINDRQLPVRFIEHCMFHDEPLHVCVTVLEERNFTGKLQILNNAIFQPRYTGFKLIIPKGGYGPITLLKKGPHEAQGRSITSFELEIPTDGENVKYESSFIKYSSLSDSSILIHLNTPTHKYYAKGFITFPTQQLEKGSTGFEISLDENIYGLRVDINFPENAKQTIVSSVLILRTPGDSGIDVAKSKFTSKENSKQIVTEISGSTLGPLTDFLQLKISGEMTKLKKDSKFDVMLKELSLEVPILQKIFVRGQLVYSNIGIDSSLYVMYGDNHDFRIVFSKGSTDFGSATLALPSQVLEPMTGSKFSLTLTGKHPLLPTPFSIAFAGTIKRSQVELEGNFEIGDDAGRILLFAAHESFFNFMTALSVDNPHRNISWTGSQEFLWLENEYKVAFNSSWSSSDEDHVGFLCHFKKLTSDTYDHSLLISLDLPQQGIELQHEFIKAVAGSYKHNLILKLNPGRVITITTVTVAGTDPKVITYGLSIDFRLDGWDSSLRIVGTANCMSTYSSCTVNVVVAKGPDQLSEFEVKYTGGFTGISRTDIKLIVEPHFSLQSSVDVIMNLGTVKLLVSGNFHSSQEHFHGEAFVNWLSTDLLEANFVVLESENVITHFYNASLSLNHDSRSIFFRQELRVDSSGQIELWAAIVQAKIGSKFLNEKHFGKVVLTTPYDTFYTLTGELTSANDFPTSFTGNIMVSADIGSGQNYLLGLDILLLQNVMNHLEDILKGNSEQDLLTFSSLGRLKVPSMGGESKLYIKAKRVVVSEAGKLRFSNGAEVRLVTETYPELGRINAKLDHDSEAFSLSCRIWSGPKSLSVESYGVASNETLKSSSSLTVIDPSKEWQMVKVSFDGHHLGTLPWNFESSADFVATVHHENLGSFRGLAQWTPSAATFNLAIGTIITEIPGGQIFFKWTLSRIQSKIAWSDLRSYLDAKWSGMGRQIGFVFNFFYPDFPISSIDSVFNFDIQEGDLWYNPQTLILKGRLTVDNIKHWITNINSKSDEKRYSLMIASIHPQSSTSFSVDAATEEGGVYHAKGSLVIDANSHHVTVAYRSSLTARDMTLHLKSSLLEEKNGYIYRMVSSHSSSGGLDFEFDMVFTEGSTPPLWSHMYRIVIESTHRKDKSLKEITARDYYAYRENFTEIYTKHFFKLSMIHDQSKESSIEIELPQLDGSPIIDGTITWPKGDEELTSFFRLEQIDNSHIVEAKFFLGSTRPSDSSLGRVIYRQKLIKGVGHKLRAELEISDWTKDAKNLRFSFQKLFSAKITSKGQSRKGGPVSEYYFRTLEGGVRFTETTGAKDYKINWTSDSYTNELAIVFEKDHAGHGGHLSYTRNSIENPKEAGEIFLLKGNFRRFSSEVTCSFTFEQSSLGRPRSVTFLHSYAESYSELVLDLAKSEEDQVILVLFGNSNEKRFKIGQLDNTFLQMAYKIADKEKQKNPHDSFLLEIAGHLLKLKISHTKPDERCEWVGFVIATPAAPSMHNSFAFCSPNDSEIKVQLLGLEENEGPYLRIGQISGPGGLGLQLGGGRLSPIDTPPALTLTADVKEEYFEILFDWQINSMNQFTNDLHSRGTAFRKTLKKLGKIDLNVKGDIGLEGVTQEMDQILEDVVKYLQPFYDEVTTAMDERRLEMMLNFLEDMRKWLNRKRDESRDSFEDQILLAENIWKSLTDGFKTWVNDKSQNAQEVFDFYLKDFKEFYNKKLCPVWVPFSGGIRALRFNDNQSLYALTSRTMSYLHTLLGRHKGLSGFIVNDALTRTEQSISRKLIWENVKTQIYYIVDKFEKMTPVDAIMFHDTAFRLQVYPPGGNWRSLAEEIAEIRKINLSKYYYKLKSYWRRTKARMTYLISPHVRGSAVLFGWEHAISWDGQFLPTLLSNSCPHLLIMLTKAPSPTAIVLHLEGDEHNAKRALTFINGNNDITIDSELKIKINGASTRMEKVDLGSLQLRKSENEVKIVSSDGLMLQCFLKKGGLCLLEVDKKNFAATAGLLGVFDFEANTDFMTSSWERPSTDTEWSSSWRISTGGECRSVPSSRLASHDQRDQCLDMFSRQNSPFIDCLQSVATKPYIEACQAGNECGSEEAYLNQCTNRHHLDSLETSTACAGPPRVRLELKSAAPTNELYEGEDASFSCESETEPRATRTEWYRDDKLLSIATDSNLEFEKETLRIHQVSSDDGGIYQCKVVNSYGITESNTFRLIVLHKPKCIQSSQTLVLPEGSSTLLECHMEANPPDVSFAWLLQNDVDHIQFPEERYETDGLTSSLEYTAWTHLDFGTVFCLAENEIGTQSVACEFHITSEGECTAPYQEKGTDELDEEIIVIGEFSCIDTIEEFIKIIKKDSERSQKIILKYLNEGTPPENINDFDSIASVSEQNIFKVLESALKSDFSQDALKVVLLIDCQRPDCKSHDNADLVRRLQDLLRETGVHLYTISEDTFPILDPEAVPNKVKRQLLGVDRTTAYLMSHAKKRNLKGKKSIRGAVDLPKDNLCSLLAIQSNGASFSLSVLKKMKKNSHKKQFQQLIGLRVLEGHKEKYLKCRICPCEEEESCKLCKPPPPLDAEKIEAAVDQDLDYEEDFE